MLWATLLLSVFSPAIWLAASLSRWATRARRSTDEQLEAEQLDRMLPAFRMANDLCQAVRR
ncbi:hypothetical protein CFN78_25745 [Amycolatopsis antarctica]|uniref:Uncharacterized protein n=1 Tax=Amycolatopsis antarctica TaxID=1854586 RepID=A0A263CWH8_9PSEU|nr:hypothetical protein CFN78_25745 [Amycolatopsis antarctica]